MHALRGLLLGGAVACGLGLASGSALAHKGSDAYLDVQETPQRVKDAASSAPDAAAEKDASQHRGFRFVLAVAIKDLDVLVPMDANADGKVTWGEVKAAMPEALLLLNGTAHTGLLPRAESAALPAGQANPLACRLQWQADGIERRSDGAYLRVMAQARCPAAQALAFHYTLFRDQDATHRLLVAGRIAGKDLLTTLSPLQPTGLVLSPGASTGLAGASAEEGAQSSQLSNSSNWWLTLRDYFGLGTHHLLLGYDHLAFLLALVLPLRLGMGLGLRSQPRPALTGALPGAALQGAAGGGGAWLALLRTVTAFTLGHSITLMLATFGWTQASPVWVEPAIALSIAVTALLNLRPVPWLRTDVLALLFGLVHGYGFAGLLREAAAPSGLLPWALAGFNLGVEAGQLLAVSAWVLVLQFLVGRHWYPKVVVQGGSVLLVLLATRWFWERVS
ncbi:MAG: HupE/UreJ family protein [Polaromonas sp.]